MRESGQWERSIEKSLRYSRVPPRLLVLTSYTSPTSDPGADRMSSRCVHFSVIREASQRYTVVI